MTRSMMNTIIDGFNEEQKALLYYLVLCTVEGIPEKRPNTTSKCDRTFRDVYDALTEVEKSALNQTLILMDLHMKGGI